MKKLLTLFTAILFVGTMWAGDVSGTINFGSASGSTNVNAASVNGDDSQGNEWTITTAGTTSFTPNAAYAQIGSGNKPATSITFTATLPAERTIKAFSAKFGGFNGTAGTVTLKVGSTSVGTGSLNASTDVIVNATNTTTSGTVLTVTVTGIAKGVKAYYISYTYDDGGDPDPVLQSIAISGIPTTTTYEENNLFDVTGLVVTGTYDVGAPAVISEGITWSARTSAQDNDSAALANYTLTAGQTSLQVKATVDEIASAWFDVTGLTVNEHVVTPGTYSVTPNNEFWGRPSQNGSQNVSANALDITVISDDVTYNLKNNASTNSYMNSTQSRAYNLYTLTISAPSGFDLTDIEFTGDTWVKPTVDVGTITAKVWEGENNSVTFTFSGTSYMTNISVTYIAKAAVSKPTISGQTPFFTITTITLDCSTDGASIYYTTNGAEPTSASSLYSAPFTLNATATVKAIAIKGEDASAINEKTFTQEDVLTISEAIDVIDGGTDLTGRYVVGYISRVESFSSTYKSITYWLTTDNTDTLEVYSGKNLDNTDFANINGLNVGDKVVVYGDLKKYGSIYEFDKNNYLVERNIATLSSIAISGEASHTAYEAGDDFDFAGLIATANYNTGYSKVVTKEENVWSASPATITASGDVTVTASFGGKNDTKVIAVTVNTYAVTFNATPANGTLKIYEDDLETLITSGDAFAKGTELYVDAKPADGYKLKVVKVIKTGVEPEEDVTGDVLVNDIITMPAYAITVAAEFEEDKGTGFEDVDSSVKAVKVLRNGVLYIEKNGRTYNAMGQVIK